MARLSGWRFALFAGGVVGTIGLGVYAVIIRPMIDPEPYREIRKNRKVPSTLGD